MKDQQSPPPSVACCLEIDDAIKDWCCCHFGAMLDCAKEVMPLFKAPQAHPKAGALWEAMITKILINKMGFKAVMHERNLCIGEVGRHEILVC